MTSAIDDARMAIDKDGVAMPFGKTHRYYRYLDAAVNDADARFTIPEGVIFMNIESNTNALKVMVTQTAAEAFDSGNAGSFAADNARPARPVTPGDTVKIQHDDGATDVGGFVLVLEGASLPSDVSINLG